MKNQIEIKPEWDVSVNDLLAAKTNGFPVIKTSHIGNLSVSSLYAHNLGFTDVLWDITDINYSSDPWIKKSTLYGDETLLDKRKYGGSRSIVSYIRSGNNIPVSHIHIKSLCSNPNITTIAKMLLFHWSEIEKVLEKCEQISTEIFDLFVTPSGTLIKNRQTCSHSQRISSFRQVLREINYQNEGQDVSTQKGGWMASFTAMSVLLYLCVYWESGQSIIYDLSGSRMISYLLSERQKQLFNRLYSHMYINSLITPLELTVHIVPTEGWKLARPKMDGYDILDFYFKAKKKRSLMKLIDIYPFKENTDMSLIIECALREIIHQYNFHGGTCPLTQHDQISTYYLDKCYMDYSSRNLHSLYNSVRNCMTSYV